MCSDEILELALTDLAHGGDAVGRHDGRAVFVPLGIPGERVRVAVVERRRRYARARLLEVLHPSPDRVEPPCPYYGRCGGCQLQHVAYPRQLALKAHVVRAQLERIGHQADPPLLPMLGMDDPWRYRNNAQFRVDRQRRVGYLALGSSDVVPVDECLQIEDAVRAAWKGLDGDLRGTERLVVRAGVRTGDGLLVIEGRAPEPPRVRPRAVDSCLYRHRDREPRVLQGSPHLHEAVRGRTFRVSADAFFQVNTRQAERLVDLVDDYLQVREGETVVDAYCGVGLFALSVTEGAARVVGIEAHPAAVRDARANAAGREDVTILRGRVEDVAPELPERVDAVIVDPPRAGCDEAALEALASRGPSRVVYVSCDPATLARDVARLGGLGYRLTRVRPVDVFPQTYHIECVALLTAADGGR